MLPPAVLSSAILLHPSAILPRLFLLQAEFMFEEGDEQTFTENDVQTTVEENIIELLASVTGSIHTDTEDGCSGDSETIGKAGDEVATCDVAVSSDDILEEINEVAEAGGVVQALACEGGGNEAEVNVIARQISIAIAQAVVQADSFCESTGGAGTMACGLSNGTVTAVARATASAFSSAMAEAMGPDCDCDLSTSLTVEEVEEIMAEATTSALAETCAGAASTAALPTAYPCGRTSVLLELLPLHYAGYCLKDCLNVVRTCDTPARPCT